MKNYEISSAQLIDMLKTSSRLLEENQAELNNINVFPVADGDTGTNMSYTLKKVCESINDQEDLGVVEICKIIAESALINSRGNSGTIIAQYLSGFCDIKSNQKNLDSESLIKQLKKGSDEAKKSFIDPKSGTILDVMEAAASSASLSSKKTTDLVEILENALEEAKNALEKTQDKLPQLKKAGVVDAGGAGFVIILTGFLSSLKQENIVITTNLTTENIGFIEEEMLKFRYCTEVVIKNSIQDHKKLWHLLTKFGDSVQIINNQEFTKVHIHSNEPQEVQQILADFGKIESYKADDMQNMQADYLETFKDHTKDSNLELTKLAIERYKTIIITDSSCDIPDYYLQRYPVKIINLPVFADKEEKINIADNLDLADFYKRMEDEPEFIPKTSKINTHSFYNAFVKALNETGRVICLPISKNLSTTYESALLAKQMLKDNPNIEIIDTQTSSSGLAIILDYILQSLEKNIDFSNILMGIEKLKSEIQIYFVVDNVKYLERGGRISKTKAGIAKILNIQPILTLSGGKIEADSTKIYFTSEAKKINSLFKKLKKYNQTIPITELFIVYAGQKALLESSKLIEKIETQLDIPKVSINLLPLNPVVGAHAGPGTIGIIFK